MLLLLLLLLLTHLQFAAVAAPLEADDRVAELAALNRQSEKAKQQAILCGGVGRTPPPKLAAGGKPRPRPKIAPPRPQPAEAPKQGRARPKVDAAAKVQAPPFAKAPVPAKPAAVAPTPAKAKQDLNARTLATKIFHADSSEAASGGSSGAGAAAASAAADANAEEREMQEEFNRMNEARWKSASAAVQAASVFSGAAAKPGGADEFDDLLDLATAQGAAAGAGRKRAPQLSSLQSAALSEDDASVELAPPKASEPSAEPAPDLETPTEPVPEPEPQTSPQTKPEPVPSTAAATPQLALSGLLRSAGIAAFVPPPAAPFENFAMPKLREASAKQPLKPARAPASSAPAVESYSDDDFEDDYDGEQFDEEVAPAALPLREAAPEARWQGASAAIGAAAAFQLDEEVAPARARAEPRSAPEARWKSAGTAVAAAAAFDLDEHVADAQDLEEEVYSSDEFSDASYEDFEELTADEENAAAAERLASELLMSDGQVKQKKAARGTAPGPGPKKEKNKKRPTVATAPKSRDKRKEEVKQKPHEKPKELAKRKEKVTRHSKLDLFRAKEEVKSKPKMAKTKAQREAAAAEQAPAKAAAGGGRGRARGRGRGPPGGGAGRGRGRPGNERPSSKPAAAEMTAAERKKLEDELAALQQKPVEKKKVFDPESRRTTFE